MLQNVQNYYQKALTTMPIKWSLSSVWESLSKYELFSPHANDNEDIQIIR